MKNNTVKYIGLAIGAYLLYQWYKNKAVAPVAPGTPQTSLEQLTNTIQRSDSLQPIMSISPGQTIVTDMMQVTAPTATVKQLPATYQTFYGESLSGSNVAKMPLTC